MLIKLFQHFLPLRRVLQQPGLNPRNTLDLSCLGFPIDLIKRFHGCFELSDGKTPQSGKTAWRHPEFGTDLPLRNPFF